VLHHHELLDGSGYPDNLHNGEITDIVRIITIADVFSCFVEQTRRQPDFTRQKAFAIMESMGDKLDMQLIQAFRPVALGS